VHAPVNDRAWQPVARTLRIRILVVDENERLLHALLQLLATEPAVQVVGSARSLDEAAVQAAALAPQLVLIDWSLPNPAGAEACRAMRRHPAPPRIVALLDDDDESYRDAAAAAGADAAVGKGRLSEALLPLLDELFPRFAQR
jgi:DNA-binding NarL/FixJ family response regulator